MFVWILGMQQGMVANTPLDVMTQMPLQHHQTYPG